MTLNILFLTVTINKRKLTGEEAMRNEKATKAYYEMKTINIQRV